MTPFKLEKDASKYSVAKIFMQSSGMKPDQSLLRVRITPVRIAMPISMTTAIIT